LLPSYISAATFVRSRACAAIGIDMELSRYEYPLLALLSDLDGSRDIRPINVTNQSKIYSRSGPAPCAVICAGCTIDKQKMNSYFREYSGVRVFETLAVFTQSKDVETGKSDVGPNGCSATFLDWYAPDRGTEESWVWSSGHSKVIISSSEDLTG